MGDDGAARLSVDLDAVAFNHARLERLGGEAELAPVVKADAYGHGLGPVALRLWAQGAHRFFVARVEEGIELRARLGPERPARIHVLDGVHTPHAAEFLAHALTPVLNSLEQVAAWRAAAATHGRRLDAALHLDTGMNRLGLSAADARALASDPDGLTGLEVELTLTQLACADAPKHPLNARQADRYAELARLFPAARTSLAATAGLFLPPRFHGQVSRPGIGLFGAGAPGGELKPVATLDAPILQVREIGAGESVGYGASFTAPHPMRVAVLAIGYADGVLRAQSGRGYGWFAGGRRALLGRISMDLTAVDVTGCTARPGDRVELFGPNLAVDTVAAHAGTIAYELLSRLGPRIVRRYVEAGGAA